MMTYAVGVLGAAFLFGLFAVLRPRDRDPNCDGGCVGCGGACKREEER